MMTKEEAIRVLELYNPFLGGDDKKLLSEAMDVAIEALHQFADPSKKVSAEGQENDPVSGKAAIDAVKRLSLGETDATRLAMRIVDYLERLPSAQPEQRWISCGERLPEKDTCFYLATITNHGLNFTTTLPDDVDVVRWDYDRRKGHNSWHWCTERTVVAWMPLPEPWKGIEHGL